MPDELTAEEVEAAACRGHKRAIEEAEASRRPNPSATLSKAFEEAGDPERVRLERRRMIDPEGGEDGDRDE